MWPGECTVISASSFCIGGQFNLVSSSLTPIPPIPLPTALPLFATGPRRQARGRAAMSRPTSRPSERLQGVHSAARNLRHGFTTGTIGLSGETYGPSGETISCSDIRGETKTPNLGSHGLCNEIHLPGTVGPERGLVGSYAPNVARCEFLFRIVGQSGEPRPSGSPRSSQ